MYYGNLNLQNVLRSEYQEINYIKILFSNIAMGEKHAVR